MANDIPKCCTDLVKDFEGYGKKLPDGRCEAYAEVINGKRDKWTLGWGCTRGVTEGMIWTRDEAESALVRELEIHAKRVEKLVTVDLNDNERGALISFDYNCGGLTDANTGRPTNTLKIINSGNRHRAAEAIAQWNKFGGKVCDGLKRRRAAEVALWLKPCGDVEPDYMPQDADEQRQVTHKTVGTIAATVAGGGATMAHQLGAVPNLSSHIDSVQTRIDQAKQVRSQIQEVKSLIPGLPKGSELYAVPGAILAAGLVVAYLLHKRSP